VSFSALSLNLICAACAVTSNAVLKHVLTGRIRWEGSVLQYLSDCVSLLKQPMMWVGGLAFLLQNLLWLFILSVQPISVATPLQITLVFLLSTVTSVAVFAEHLSVTGYLGLGIMLFGILMLRHGTTAPA
jgi:multidrug transporter EmrE-like cation transporter